MSQLSPVTFHGDTIFCIDYQNQPYTPMRPIVENMGLVWAAQSVKLHANKERWSVSIIETVAQDGNRREMLSMPVRKLPAWLNSINPKKVRPELRAKIELYQNESDDALWNYWVNGRAERPSPDATRPSRRTDPERKALTAIINTWVGMAPIHYASARAQVNAHFGVASVDALTVAQVKDAIRWVQAKIDALPAVPAPVRTPALTASSVYADRMKALDRLEEEWIEFAMDRIRGGNPLPAAPIRQRALARQGEHLSRTAEPGMFPAEHLEGSASRHPAIQLVQRPDVD